MPDLADDALDARKRSHVQLALERAHGNRNTLYRRLREFRIES